MSFLPLSAFDATARFNDIGRLSRQRAGCFLQSRLLPDYSSVDVAWRESLFRYMNDKPRSAIYSMAFMIVCLPTHDITTASFSNRDGIGASAFEAARELLDLMDDSIRITDALNLSEVLQSRAFDETDFVKANDSHMTAYDNVIVPIVRRYRALFPLMVEPRSRRQIVDAFTLQFSRNENTSALTFSSELTLDLAIEDMRAVLTTLLRVNESAGQTGMRIPANARCSASLSAIDLSRVEKIERELTELAHAPRERSREEARSLDESSARRVALCLTEYITDANISREGDETLDETIDDRPMGSPDVRSYTIIEAYAYYAPVVHRYQSLVGLIGKWNDTRDNARKSDPRNSRSRHEDDEYLRCIMIPTRSVWQSGTSQILWIVLHTLAALTIERRNYYIKRILVLCSNLSYFIWCTECSWHWSQHRGNEYFRNILSLPVVMLHKLPIDIILLRCHNTILANSSRNVEALSLWTIGHLCVDFRDFVTRGLLRRSSSSWNSAIAARLTLCRPMFRALNMSVDDATSLESSTNSRLDSIASQERAERLLTLALAPIDLSSTTNTDKQRMTTSGVSTTVAQPLERIALLAMRSYYGEQLMRQLWHYIDPRLNAPICAMW